MPGAGSQAYARVPAAVWSSIVYARSAVRRGLGGLLHPNADAERRPPERGATASCVAPGIGIEAYLHPPKKTKGLT